MDEDFNISRRQFGKLAAGAILASTSNAEASDAETVERDKRVAIDSILSKIEVPGNEKVLAHISTYAFWGKNKAGAMSPAELRYELQEESEMQIPDGKDTKNILKKYGAEFAQLSKKMAVGKYGLFLDGDDQSLYIITKSKDSSLQFIKKYPVATSYSDWSNAQDSRGTPTGPTSIKEKRIGLLGQVISTLDKNADDSLKFTRIPISAGAENRQATFVKGLTLKTQPTPEVITAALLLDPSRGIWIHGAPRKGLSNIPPEKRRDTAGSTGCVRASNVDVVDMMRYVEVGTPMYIYGKNPAREPDLGWVKFK